MVSEKNRPNIKILFPIGSFYPDQSGGPANTVYWLCKGLKKEGFDLKICTTDRGLSPFFPRNRWLKTDTGLVRYVPTKINDRPLYLLLISIKELFKTDMVYLTSMFYPLSFLIMPFSVFTGKTTVWSVRGELSPEALKISPRKKKPVLWLARKLAGRLIFHSTNPQETIDIRQAIGPKTSILELPLLMELPEKLNLEKKNQLLFLGRIHPIKGIEFLLKGLSISHKFRQTDCRLAVAGKGESDYLNELKSIADSLGISQKIDWLGPIEGLEKQRLLAESRASFLPSFSENFGATVAESLAQGTPAMASTNTPWQVLNEKNAGWWIEKSPESLAKIIDQAIGLPENEYAAMSQNALELVKKQFDLHSNIGQYSAAFRSLFA